MATYQNFGWAQTTLDKLVPQLQNAGIQLNSLGALLGLTPAQVTDWNRGAAVLSWMQDAILVTRNTSTALTNVRDRLL